MTTEDALETLIGLVAVRQQHFGDSLAAELSKSRTIPDHIAYALRKTASLSVELNDVVALKLSLEAGVDPNTEFNSFGSSLLHQAALRGFSECLNVLVQHGAAVHRDDFLGDTPLHWAAKRGHLDCVRFLLSKGADVNALSQNGSRPLDLALNEGQSDCAELLRSHGATRGLLGRPDQTPANSTAEGQTILHTAVQDYTERGITRALTICSVNFTDDQGETPAAYALRNGREDVFQRLLEHGADINVIDHSGQTLAYKAARFGRLKSLMMLMKRGADVTVKAYDGKTPREAASQGGHASVVLSLDEWLGRRADSG